MNDLQAFSDAPEIVEVRGLKVEVRQVKMKDLSKFAVLASPILAAFDEHINQISDKQDRKPDDFALFGLISKNADAFIGMCAYTTNIDTASLGELRPDEFFEIASKVVEVNGAFFIKALAPSLIKVAVAIASVGSILASDLSAQGIDGQT